VNLKVEDYFQTGKRSMIRFSEKGGKETEIPVHHKLEELLDQYLETSGPRNLGTTWIKNDGHFGTAFAENRPTIVERDR
jgi:hypothetical protein